MRPELAICGRITGGYHARARVTSAITSLTGGMRSDR